MGAPTVTKTVTETVKTEPYLTVTLAGIARVYAWDDTNAYWIPAKVKYYSGSAWVQKPLKVYNEGTSSWLRIA